MQRSLLDYLPELKAAMDHLDPNDRVKITHFYRCNSEIWWLAEVKDETTTKLIKSKLERCAAITEDPELGDDSTFWLQNELPSNLSIEATAQLIEEGKLPAPTVSMARSHPGRQFRRKNKLTGEWFWFSCECGGPLQAGPSWEYVCRDHRMVRRKTTCILCKGRWIYNRGGSRLIQIHSGRTSIQIILDEPPEFLYNTWQRHRDEYYRRMEPETAPGEDPQPWPHPKLRLRWRSESSDAAWNALMTTRGYIPRYRFVISPDPIDVGLSEEED
jgi:hypothetical protein